MEEKQADTLEQILKDLIIMIVIQSDILNHQHATELLDRINALKS